LTADEEGGCCNGARWLVQNHRDLVDAADVVNEGGFGYIRNGKPQANAVEATQKVFAVFTVTAKNPGGHSSLPRPDNAIYELAAAITRFSTYAFPVELNPVSKAFFEKTADVETPANAAAMRAIVKNPNDSAALAVLSKDPLYNSTLRKKNHKPAGETTCVATMLKGGHALNALPQTAEVSINCRMVPTANSSEVRAAIVRALGEPALEVSPATNREPPAPSPLLPEVMGSIETITKEMWGNIPVIPTMMTGATDAQPWRSLGIPAYGVSGIMLDPSDLRTHGRDERLPMKSLYEGQEFLYRLTKALSAAKVVP
jgi:acetylornithine deacetylase/succinyl-diaminopimelate desuccinylase-like protein